MEQKYRIAFHVGDTGFEIESTDVNWLENKQKDFFAKLLEHPQQRQQTKFAEQRSHQAPSNLSPNITINEFYKKYIKANNITSRQDIAVFFIYYLQKIQKKDSIKTSDITQCFAEVAYPNYNKLNTTDILSKAKKKAFLNNINNLWLLTITGEDFVLNTMTGENK